MQSITDKIAEVVLKESAALAVKKTRIKEVEQVLTEIKKTGLVKQPNYNLPMVDTIGKTYYTNINKRR